MQSEYSLFLSIAFDKNTTMDDVFSFEDMEEGISPPLMTTPLPGALSLDSPHPGMLFALPILLPQQ